MSIDLELAERCVSLLQEMIGADPGAVTELVNARVKCSDRLADHPTIQVSDENDVGLLGVLNGLCGVYEDGPRKGWGAVAVVFDDDGKARGAKVLK